MNILDHPCLGVEYGDVRVLREATGEGLSTCKRVLQVRNLTTAIEHIEDIEEVKKAMLWIVKLALDKDY